MASFRIFIKFAPVRRMDVLISKIFSCISLQIARIVEVLPEPGLPVRTRTLKGRVWGAFGDLFRNCIRYWRISEVVDGSRRWSWEVGAYFVERGWGLVVLDLSM